MNPFLFTGLPVMTNAHIVKKAEDILKQFKITTGPVDTQIIAEALGYRVCLAKFKGTLDESLAACSFPNQKSIYVNTALTISQRLYAIAHQLGMYLLFPDYMASDDYRCLETSSLYSTKNNEEDAGSDVFALNLMAPKKAVRSIKDYGSIDEMATVFMIPKGLVLRQVGELK